MKSNLLFATLCAVVFTLTLPGSALGRSEEFRPNLMVSKQPYDPIYANAGENLRNGVGSIFIEFEGIPVGGYICTASAISPTEILTAAHCVLEEGDTVRRIRFILNAGEPTPIILEAASFVVNPLYPALLPFQGAAAHGDLAVIQLAEAIPANIETYELYREPDEFDVPVRHYGHGTSGTGQKGVTESSDFFYSRTGLNRYEATAQSLFGFPLPDQLLSDFDSGGRSRNAMDWWFGPFFCNPENDNPDQARDGRCTTLKANLFSDFRGFGDLEVGVAPGDSGGPAFIDGKIAGVHSFGFTHGCAVVTNRTDVDCFLNSSFGEMSGDVRVSFWASWIDAAVSGVLPVTPIPEPIGAVAPAMDISDLELPQSYRQLLESQVVLARSLKLRVK